MTTGINIIKNNKLILRDYAASIKEHIFHIEKHNENNNENNINNYKIEKYNNYKSIFKEYIHNNFSNEINENDIECIYDNALLFVAEDCRGYNSIFEDNLYHDLIKNLKDISNHFY